ncbi:MAG: AMP-binding protein, partial [Myxococcota bacterium]
MTPAEALRRAAAIAPDHEAYVYRGRRVSYGNWHELARRVAANLVDRGLERGDRLALVLPPRPEYAVAFLGAAGAGLVGAGVNPRLGNLQIVQILHDSGARAAVVIDRFG